MLSLNLPLLSQIEHSEAVRSLSVMKRVEYTVLYLVLIVVAFTLAIAAATTVAVLAFGAITNVDMTFDQTLVMIFPVAGAFMVAVGFSSSPLPEVVMPGDTLHRVLRRAVRTGLISGFITGTIFGLLWSLVIRIGLVYIHLNTMFSQTFDVGEVVLFSVLLGLIIAPIYAVFRAFSGVTGHLLLHLLNKL